MNDELVSQVEDLGLSQKEARVYVANLVLGASSVQKIADFANIKRVTTYVILESLINLGLVSQTTKGKKAFFNAEDPANLRRLLDKKQQELAEQQSNLESILPQLKSLKSLPSESPAVRFYEGAEGIRSIFNNLFESHRKNRIEEVYGISNADQVWEFFPEIKAGKSNPERVRLGIKSRYIYTTEKGPIYKETDKAMLRESRWVPPDQFPLHGDFNISGNYVVMVDFGGSRPIGVVIESKGLAKSMIQVFEMAWQAAAPYNSPKSERK